MFVYEGRTFSEWIRVVVPGMQKMGDEEDEMLGCCAGLSSLASRRDYKEQQVSAIIRSRRINMPLGCINID